MTIDDRVRLMPFLSDSQRLEASAKATRLIVDPPAETSPAYLHLWHIERSARLVIVAVADQSGRTVHEMLTSEISKRVRDGAWMGVTVTSQTRLRLRIPRIG